MNFRRARAHSRLLNTIFSAAPWVSACRSSAKYIAAELWWSAQSLVKAMRAKARVPLCPPKSSTSSLRLESSTLARAVLQNSKLAFSVVPSFEMRHAVRNDCLAKVQKAAQRGGDINDESACGTSRLTRVRFGNIVSGVLAMATPLNAPRSPNTAKKSNERGGRGDCGESAKAES